MSHSNLSTIHHLMKKKQTYSFFCLFILFFLSIQITFSQSTKQYSLPTDSVGTKYKSEPVVLFNDTIFYIHTNLGAFTAKERALGIAKRIKAISEEQNFKPDSLVVIPSEESYNIVFQDIILMSITPKDAKIENKSQEELAYRYLQIIVDAIKKHDKETSWLNLLKQIGLVILILTILYFMIKYVNILFRKFNLLIKKQKGKLIKGINIKSYNLLDEDKAVRLLLFFTNIIRYLTLATLLYLVIPLLFSIFPSTQGLAEQLLGYIIKPFLKIIKAIIGYIPNLITILVIVIVFRYLIKGIKYMAEEISNEKLKIKGFFPDWAIPTYNIIRALLYAFMFIIIFPYLPGSKSPVFQGVSVFIGIIFSLGSTSIIGNIVSGLVITYMRPFKIGDRIKIGDFFGNVIEKTPFVTRIRTPKNEEITIPNSNIMSSQTINYTNSADMYGLILHTEVTIGYEIPWRKVHELLISVAMSTPDVMHDPKPFVLQTALNDSCVEYQINVFTKDADKMTQIHSYLRQNIQDKFSEAGIEIMSPFYVAQRDGNQTTIPQKQS